MVYNKKGVKRRDDEENDERKIKMMKKNRLDDVGSVEKGKKTKMTKMHHSIPTSLTYVG